MLYILLMWRIIFFLQRYEDTTLELKDLPAPKLVVTPEGLPNECFGDVAMITEFIANYSGLLMPEDEYPIYTGTVMSLNIVWLLTLCPSPNY